MNLQRISIIHCQLVIVSLLTLSCDNLQADDINSPFEYREIYLPEQGSDMAHQLHLNDINTDWGLWGHNLSTVVPKKHSQTIYATSGGNLVRDQFCFASPKLYEYIADYIDSNYGKNRSNRFAILPNDNDIVCLCADCRSLGNTEHDASPAVFALISKLAEHFPMHQFFTSYYRTTRSLPAQQLPDNVGVLISTMSYPLCAVETEAETNFAKLLQDWSDVCNLVYVWDYINNFDDYFTPFPVFNVMQRRFQLYARSGVKGLFLNGSGNDFSTFSTLHTHILALLMLNPDADWRGELTDLCSQHYPKSGNIVARFIIAQEDYTKNKAHVLPIYEGVKRATETYLPADTFIAFFDTLRTMQNKTLAWERAQIGTMVKTLSLTRLELMRMRGDVSDVKPLLDLMATLPVTDNIDVYSESCWTIESYLRDYRYMLTHATSSQGNLLRGATITPLTSLDEEYTDISILTDGLLGLPSNYHSGQMLSSADPALKLSIPSVDGMRHLRLCFTRNPLYHIDLPKQVTLSIGSVEFSTAVPHLAVDHAGHAYVDFDIPESHKGSIVVTIVRNTDERTMALDEIEAFE